MLILIVSRSKYKLQIKTKANLIESDGYNCMSSGAGGVHSSASHRSVGGPLFHLRLDSLVATNHLFRQTLHVESPDGGVLSHLARVKCQTVAAS